MPTIHVDHATSFLFSALPPITRESLSLSLSLSLFFAPGRGLATTAAPSYISSDCNFPPLFGGVASRQWFRCHPVYCYHADGPVPTNIHNTMMGWGRRHLLLRLDSLLRGSSRSRQPFSFPSPSFPFFFDAARLAESVPPRPDRYRSVAASCRWIAAVCPRRSMPHVFGRISRPKCSSRTVV